MHRSECTCCYTGIVSWLSPIRQSSRQGRSCTLVGKKTRVYSKLPCVQTVNYLTKDKFPANAQGSRASWFS